MTSNKAGFDVIVVGGGHNGLVCAHSLASAGRKVLVLEARQKIGGAASTTEITKSFSVSDCAQWLFQLNPKVIKRMQLNKHGLRMAATNLSTIALAENGKHLTLSATGVSGAGISEADIIAYQRFDKQMLKFAKLLAGAFERRAPKLLDKNFTDRWTLLKLGLGIKLLGKQDMSDLLRLGLINICDVMEENFEHPLLKAAISMDAILGAHMGPRSPNTVFTYLYRKLGAIYGYTGPSLVRGGMGALGAAMAESAKAEGVVIRLGSAVERINIESGRVTGVTLQSGETIDASTVVSNADPKKTFADMVGYSQIETGVARRVHNIRMQGNTAKLHIALDGLPEFKGLSEQQLGQRLLIAPTMDYIEQAFNACKYGEYSKAPAIDISIPSMHDSSLAPHGRHVLSATVQYAPYQLSQGWSSAKDKFKQLVIDKIASYAPKIKSKILHSELLTPEDIETQFGCTGGHWHHGEISLDQIMMMRPFPGASQYRTSVDGLFLCGAGTHPGGGVMGLCGSNAAREIIKGGVK